MPFAQATSPTAAAAAQAGAPFDVSLFLRNNHIHIQHHSIIDPLDPLLLIHPAELSAENEPKLRQKIDLAYRMDHPSIFTDGHKTPLMDMLASYIPLSPEGQAAKIAHDETDLILQTSKGIHPDVVREQQHKDKPFSAVMREYLDDRRDIRLRPDLIEQARNAVGMYLILEKALHDRGFSAPLYQFTEPAKNADGVMARVAEECKTQAETLIQASQQGGYEGVGRALGVDEHYMRDVERLTHYLGDHYFSANAIKSWQDGYDDPRTQGAGTQERIDVGHAKRIDQKISELHKQPINTTTPPAVQQQEQKMLTALSLVPSEISETLYRLGTDFAYTSEFTVDPISPKSHAYGFHRHVTLQPDDIGGIRHIFAAATASQEDFLRTVVHEAHHLLFPNRFTKPQMDYADALTKAEEQRLGQLLEITQTWINPTTNDATRQQLWQRLNSQEFAVGGVTLAQALGNTSMETFANHVQHAHERLNINSELYHKGGYTTPESRFKEINSRYSELRFVRMRDEPALLTFIAPNTTAIYENLYMPHIREQLETLRAQDTTHAEQPSTLPLANNQTTTATPPCCANGNCPNHQAATLSAPQQPLALPRTTIAPRNASLAQIQAPTALSQLNL